MHPAIHTTYDHYVPNDEEPETQQATQSTQNASQPPLAGADENAHLWGFLQPCGSQLRRIDFFKVAPTVSIGRNPEVNEVVLPGARVSNRHCRIIWDGKEDEKSAVIVADLSSNGTWINGVRIGKDNTAILKEGNEIAFGTPQPQPGSLEDYRFIYRHTAAGPPKKGIHAFYDISHELGKGSFATVMKAISRSTGQWFAIKMIQESRIRRATPQEHSRNADKEQKDSMFMREISILESLHHVNICQLKEVFREGDNIDLVLEYVDGGDLLEFILKHERLDESMAVHLTRQICAALAYIHGKGIAHRDLKPENVLLTSDNPPIVKIADFGLAKVVDSLTCLKTMCGTPNYLAPEVVNQKGADGYSHLVDSWSVGVIVFSMLTGLSPFVEDEAKDVKDRITNRTIDWSSLDVAGVSDVAQDFIRQLLQYDPQLRMSLAAARHHPWLEPPADRQGFEEPLEGSLSEGSSPLTSLPEDEVEAMEVAMRDAAAQGYGGFDAGNSHTHRHEQNGGETAMRTRLEQLRLDTHHPAQQRGRGQGSLPVLAQAAEEVREAPRKRKLNDRTGQNAAGEGLNGGAEAEERDVEASMDADADESWGNLEAPGHANGRAAANANGHASARGRGREPAAGRREATGVRSTRAGGRGRASGRAAGAGTGAVAKTRLHELAAGMVVEEEHYGEENASPSRQRRSSRHSPAKARRV